VAIPGICGVSEYYMNKNSVHAKSERLYVVVRKDSIFKQIYLVVVGRRKKKCIFLHVSTCWLKEGP